MYTCPFNIHARNVPTQITHNHAAKRRIFMVTQLLYCMLGSPQTELAKLEAELEQHTNSQSVSQVKLAQPVQPSTPLVKRVSPGVTCTSTSRCPLGHKCVGGQCQVCFLQPSILVEADFCCVSVTSCQNVLAWTPQQRVPTAKKWSWFGTNFHTLL